MANVLVLGVHPDSAYAQARAVLAAGHNACVALSREQAFRKLLSGLIDTIMLDCALDTAAQTALFRALRLSVPTLPAGWAQGAPLPPAPGASGPVVFPSRRPAFEEPLMRAVAYLYGVAEGRRLAIQTDVELTCDGVHHITGVTTALQTHEAIVEFLDQASQRALLGLTLLGPDVPAVVRLHFPGGGVLRVAGTVEAALSRRGVTALKLTAAAGSETTPAMVEPAREAPDSAVAALLSA